MAVLLEIYVTSPKDLKNYTMTYNNFYYMYCYMTGDYSMNYNSFWYSHYYKKDNAWFLKYRYMLMLL